MDGPIVDIMPERNADTVLVPMTLRCPLCTAPTTWENVGLWDGDVVITGRCECGTLSDFVLIQYPKMEKRGD
jgi:hypothetical protein